MLVALACGCGDTAGSAWRGTNLSRVYVSPGSGHAVVRCVRARSDRDDDALYLRTSWVVVDLRAGTALDVGRTSEVFPPTEAVILDAEHFAIVDSALGPVVILELATGDDGSELARVIPVRARFVAPSPSGRWAVLPGGALVELATRVVHEGVDGESFFWLPGDRLLVAWPSSTADPGGGMRTTELGVWDVDAAAQSGFPRDEDGRWAAPLVRASLRAPMGSPPWVDTTGRVAAWKTFDGGEVERLDLETGDVVRSAGFVGWPLAWSAASDELVALSAFSEMTTYDRAGLRRARSWALPSPVLPHVTVAEGRYLLGYGGGGPEWVVLTDVERGEAVTVGTGPILPGQTAERAGAPELWLAAWGTRSALALHRVDAEARSMAPIPGTERSSAVAYARDLDAFVALEVECEEVRLIAASTRDISRRIALPAPASRAP